MSDPNQELQTWMTDWQHADARPVASDALAQYVRRRSALLVTWIVGEILVGTSGVLVLSYLALVRADPIERLLMGMLAVACLAALAFTWWNWRGSVWAVAQTTAAFLDLAATRLLRIRRGITAGWILLAVEMAVFTPWVWYRVHGGAVPEGSATHLWPWAFLATMATLAIAGLLAVGRWVRREESIVSQLRREHADHVTGVLNTGSSR